VVQLDGNVFLLNLNNQSARGLKKRGYVKYPALPSLCGCSSAVEHRQHRLVTVVVLYGFRENSLCALWVDVLIVKFTLKSMQTQKNVHLQ